MSQTTPESGFTLVEIIGVLAIIAILSAVIAPRVISHLDSAARDAEVQSLESLAEAIQVYFRENRAWPPNLDSLSPKYVSLSPTQLTQNARGFPRYFVIHPDTSGFNNAAGLSATQVADAQFLLISNMKGDAAPTITNATEFTTWWDTDETGTPDLKIHRGQVSHLFRLLALHADGSRGSYQIDGTTTNWDCRSTPPLNHNQYHLVGTRVALDEMSPYAAPEIHFSKATETGYHYDPCHPTGSRWRKMPVANSQCWSIWFTTSGDVGSPSGTTCLDTWENGEVLQLGDPNLVLEPGTTNGIVSAAINLDGFSMGGVNGLTAVHYVTTDLTVGASNTIDLFAGDVLLSTANMELLTSTNALLVLRQDVFVFRPDTQGDYSSGTFIMLLDGLSGGWLAPGVTAISLIEKATRVGDTTLQAGTFLFSDTNQDIKHFTADSVGFGVTSGTTSTFMTGSHIGIGQNIAGIDLVEDEIEVGTTTLMPGSMLVTLDGSDASVGSNNISVQSQDVFFLTVQTTTMGSGASAANATLLMEGADVGLNVSAENLAGISTTHTL